MVNIVIIIIYTTNKVRIVEDKNSKISYRGVALRDGLLHKALLSDDYLSVRALLREKSCFSVCLFDFTVRGSVMMLSCVVCQHKCHRGGGRGSYIRSQQKIL